MSNENQQDKREVDENDGADVASDSESLTEEVVEDDEGEEEQDEEDEQIPVALNGLIADLESKAARYRLSRTNVKNILKHVMQSEEMVALLRDELSADESRINTSSGLVATSQTASIFSSSMRMTRQRFRQLAGDKICPDLEVLLSRMPAGPARPKSFFEIEFPEDDPEDSEYDPCNEENEMDESLVSPSNAAATPSVGETTIVESNATPSTSAQDELIAKRTRSRFPLPHFDIDAIAPLPPELNFDVDSMSPTSPSRLSGGLLSIPGSQVCASPSGSTNPAIDDDEVYAQFLATVFDLDDETEALVSDTQLNAECSTVSLAAPPSNIEPGPPSTATDEEQDDPDYNPFQDIDILLEFDPDEYAWDKRARIPKEEVRSLRKEAFADLPMHCHLLETCVEAANARYEIPSTPTVELRSSPTDQQSLSTRKRSVSAVKNSSASKRFCESSSKMANPSPSPSSSSSSSDESDTTLVEDSVAPEEPPDAGNESQQPVFIQNSLEFSPNQLLIIQEQIRQHIQILLQSYIIAGSAPEAAFVSHQSSSYIYELEMLRLSAPRPEASLLKAWNLAPAIHFLNCFPPEAIGLPDVKDFSESDLKQQVEKNLSSKHSRTNHIRPSLSLRQMDLMVYHCPALLYACLLPKEPCGFFNVYCQNVKAQQRLTWLPCEDDLVALGLEQFWPAGGHLRNKATLIKKYLIPVKEVANILARIKNVFYGAWYQNSTDNPIKIFQRYNAAPQYDVPICNFQPDEVVPLRQLPPDCLPRWFQKRVQFWQRLAHRHRKYPSKLASLTYLAVEKENEMNEEDSFMTSTVTSNEENQHPGTSSDNQQGEDYLCDELEVARGATEALENSNNEDDPANNDNHICVQAANSNPKSNVAISEKVTLADLSKNDTTMAAESPMKQSLVSSEIDSSCELTNSPPPRWPEQSSSQFTFSSPKLSRNLVESSPSLAGGHGAFSSVDEEAAVFLTPVKNFSSDRREFDSDPRSSLPGPSLVDAASSDSVPASHRFTIGGASPLRAKQPLLAKLLASLTPKATTEAKSPAKSLVATIIMAPIPASTPSTSFSPMIRQKRARRSFSRSETSGEARKLRLIAPAAIANPPPKSLLDASEIGLNSQASLPASPNKGTSKLVDNIRARALKTSRMAAFKRNWFTSASNGNSNANPPLFDDDIDDPEQRAVVADGPEDVQFIKVDEPTVKRRNLAPKKKNPPRLNEKQRQRLTEMYSASFSARRTADALIDSSNLGTMLPFAGLSVGDLKFEDELANTYLELLETSLPPQSFIDILELMNSFNSDSIDVTKLYSNLKQAFDNFGRSDLLTNFSSFLTSRQAMDCGCFQNYAEFDAICEFLIQHQASFGSRNVMKSLQNLVRILTTSAISAKSFSNLENEFSQIVGGNQSTLLEQLTSFFPDDNPVATRCYPDAEGFETIYFNSHVQHQTEENKVQFSRHSMEFECMKLSSSWAKSGTNQCLCSCHTSGHPLRISAVVQTQLSELKRHCRLCGVTVMDGKLYVPDAKNGFRLKRIAMLIDKREQLVQPYESLNAIQQKSVELIPETDRSGC